MQALTSETANQLCKDLEDFIDIINLLAGYNSLTPSVLSAIGNCANSCEKFLIACSKLNLNQRISKEEREEFNRIVDKTLSLSKSSQNQPSKRFFMLRHIIILPRAKNSIQSK